MTPKEAPRSKIQDPEKHQPPRSHYYIKMAQAIPSSELGAGTWWDFADPVTALREEPTKHKANARHPFDLEERTAVFGESLVKFYKRIPRDPANDRLTSQLVGAATSIGANYCEANEGVSRKDFRHPISRCVKEAKETKLFLRMIVASEPQFADEARALYREAHELLLIFASIYRK